MTSGQTKPAIVGMLGVATAACLPSPATAQDLTALDRQLGELRLELAAQRALLDEQSKRIARQQEELDRLRRLASSTEILPASPRPSPAGPPADPSPAAVAATSPTQPIGESPDLPRVEQQVGAVLEGAGVLTRAGHLVIEPSLQYTNSSSNRLVFRGVELIPGIQVGLIEASAADRDAVVATGTVRYGLTGNVEIEGRFPYLYRSDRVTAMQQRQDMTEQSSALHEHGLGDIELGLRYQINHPVGEKPILIGTFRVKSDTGRSPFAVPFDSSGVAQGLATGSGFWAVQPGVNFLLPSDPVVIFGGTSYLHQFPKNIDKTLGDAMIGRVRPGDAITADLGFGFALNPRFSFSLGYQHSYLFPMRWEINGAGDRSSSLQVGSLLVGMSYRVTERQLVNIGLEVGATQDAPDVSLTIRAPFSAK
ncbi:transporter [Sphingomonas bacterium]|uniref:transporter n=1 Tax=Sphingomonas bacterium TaxID=1895847 RepID=UPI0015757CD2|nr:transporter [Sphingomonas bacterium]